MRAIFSRSMQNILRTGAILLFIAGILHAITFVLLNQDYFQRKLFHEINSKALKDTCVAVKFDSAMFHFFTGTLVLNNPSVNVADERCEWVKTTRFKFRADTLGIDVSIWRSFLYGRAFLKRVTLDGSVLEFESIEKDEPFDIYGALVGGKVAQVLSEFQLKAPRKIKISNASVQAKMRDAEAWHMGVNLLEVENQHSFTSTKSKSVLSAEIGSFSRGSERPAPATSSSPTRLVLSATGSDLVLEKAEISLGQAKLDARGAAQIDLLKRTLTYRFWADGKVDLAAAGNLVGLDASGIATLNVQVNPEDAARRSGPKVKGALLWTNAVLEDFWLHRGSGDLEITKESIVLENVDVRTAKGGHITAPELRFAFKDQVPFSAVAKVENLPFSNLMEGLDVPVDFIDFSISSPQVLVSGEAFHKDGEDFKLQITSESVNVKKLMLPTIPTRSARAFIKESCNVNLKLYSDISGLDVAGSSLSCAEQEDVRVLKGQVRYSDGDTQFDIEGNQVELSGLEYFLASPVQGIGSFKSKLTGSKTKMLRFNSQVSIKNALIYAVPLQSVTTNLEINERELLIRNLNGNNDDVSHRKLTLPELTLKFDPLLLRIDGNYSGPFESETLYQIGIISTDLREISADIENARFKIDVPLERPSLLDLELDVKADQVSGWNAVAKTMSSRLNCKRGLCTDGVVSATDIAPKTRPANVTNYVNYSSIQMHIHSLTAERFDVSGTMIAVPLMAAMPSTMKVSGLLDSDFHTRGTWSGEVNGFVRSRIDGLRVDQIDFGETNFIAKSENDFVWNGSISTAYSQVHTTFSVPVTKRPGSVNISLQQFNLAAFVPEEIRYRENLFSRLTAHVRLTVPSLKEIAATKDENFVLANLNGEGVVQDFLVQIRQATFISDRKTSVRIRAGHLVLPQWSLKSGTNALQGSASVGRDARGLNVSGDLSFASDFALLSSVFDELDAGGEGTFEGKLRFAVRGNAVSVQGRSRIQGASLPVKNTGLPFTEVRGDVVFDGERVFLQGIRAKKGSGRVALDGWVSIGDFMNKSQDYPALALRISGTNAQFRFPSPVFRSVDSNLDFTLDVSGKGIPYKVSGPIRVRRAIVSDDVTCVQIVNSASKTSTGELNQTKVNWFDLNLSITADKSILVQTACMNTSISTELQMTGTRENLQVLGYIRAGNGSVYFQKRRYSIRQMEVIFESSVRLDPRIDWEFATDVMNYRVFVRIDGRVSGWRTDLWTDPPNLPDGSPFTRQDILRMLSSGVVPASSSSEGGGYVLANTAAGLLVSPFDDPLTETFSRLTGGFFDSVQLRPVIEEGQNKMVARFSRALGERINLSVDVDIGPASSNNTQSMRGTWLLNRRVNLLGEIDRKTGADTGVTNEFLGGVRFQFGSD